ncbi:TadE/TadG family type IV pilus assembly protein [Herminiimonas sp. CN]|uniref:TadE/TadG family type IV pilus assembly protein n=1 Tax=Herminiimonas sp. CN TaxID=1349818 RepID=UPI0004732791|nr:TadE/TadG family type IV pilus assembly protein [Herminiimonas sp. CN]
MNTNLLPLRRGEHGAVAVEFALVASIFFTLLFGIMEMSRVLFYMNTAAEATRLGARVAVVCDVNTPAVKTKMINMLGILSAGDISVDYKPTGCSSSTCQSVTVSVTKSVNTFIPFVPLTFSLPPFATTLPRESLTSADNSICS